VGYRELREKFRWEVPEEFNFGWDVIDLYAEDRGRTALYWEDKAGREERYTFWNVKTLSNRLGNVLKGLGIRRGDPVLLMLPRIPQWQIAFSAVLKIGALAIPCSPTLEAKSIQFRATHSQAKAIITTVENTAEVDAIRAACPSLSIFLSCGGAPSGWTDWDQAMTQAAANLEPGQTRSNEPALVYYSLDPATSPKAVLHTHAYPFAHRYTGRCWLDLRRTDLHWSTADPGQAEAAYSLLFGPWSQGVPVFMYQGDLDPQKELSLLEKYEMRVFCASPIEYCLLLKENISRSRLPDLRHCTSMGEPPQPEVIYNWQDVLDLIIHNGYGQVETTLLTANLPGVPVKFGSIGLPFPGHTVSVIDPGGRELLPGEVGDIALQGSPPSLFREYWHNPQATQSRRRGEWYVTGDQGYKDEEGYFWLAARNNKSTVANVE
jgi:acyl-coenzyme A synthetase/AMP-(fatty) acid ligase